MMKCLRKLFIIVIAILCIGSLTVSAADLPATLDAEPKRVLTVAFPEAKGLHEVYADGTYGGIVYDWLIEIAKYTNWDYKFVTGEASGLLRDMMDGKYDLMGSTYYMDILTENFCYPDNTMGFNYSLLIYPESDNRIKSFDVKTLNGKTIGVMKKATSKINRLNEYLMFNDLDCELKYYTDEKLYMDCLENKEVDLMLGSDVYMKDSYNVAVKFPSDSYYIVTPKNEAELCKELDAAMTEIYAANPNFAQELYNKYFPERYINSISFSNQDLQFLKQVQSVKVAVAEDNYPIYYLKDNVPRGIVPDILSLITEKIGLHFEYVVGKNYADSIELVQNGQADILGSFMDSEYHANDYGLTLTKNYATLNEVVLRDRRIAYLDEKRPEAVMEGRLLSTSSEDKEKINFATYRECLKAINSGKASRVKLPVSCMENLLLEDYYPNITIMSDESAPTQLTIALPKPVNTALYSVLSKAVNDFSVKEIDGIMARNLVSMGASKVTLTSLIYTNPLLAIIASASFLSLIVVIIFLNSHFKMKNKLMRLKLEEAEETGRAKMNFLSNMSHEIRTPMNAIIGFTNLTLQSEDIPSDVRVKVEKIDKSAQYLLSLINDILDMAKISNSKMKLNYVGFRIDDLLQELENVFRIPAEQKDIRLLCKCDIEDEFFVGDELRIKQVLMNLLSNACKFTNPGGNVILEIKEMRQTEKSDGERKIFFSVKDNGIGISSEDAERIFESFEQAGTARENSGGTGLGLTISSSLVNLMGGKLSVNSKVGEGSDFCFMLSLKTGHETLPPLKQDVKAKPVAGSKPYVGLEGIHLLLAEDNDLNAEIVEAFLRSHGILVERANDGQSAVERFKASSPYYYSIILMDVQMPVKNGLVATAEIRALAREDVKTIPIIAMTANVFDEYREKERAAGMSGFIPKPFNAAELYDTLEQAVLSAKAVNNTSATDEKQGEEIGQKI
ncbi:MAG: transporter substrate-binding domain-containing protein [Clostridium sp.]